MSNFPTWAARARGLFADSRGPWGSGSGGGNSPGDAGGTEPPRANNPWGSPPPPRRPGGPQLGNVTALDDFLKRSRAKFGGGGGGIGGGGGAGAPNRRVIVWALAALAVLWLLFTTLHAISPGERGVVTTLGNYSRTLGPGIGFTLPAPIERVEKVDVENIREDNLGSASEETLMLTGDQNIIDIAYQVRWNIRDPEAFLFNLAEPEETVRQVAESAMRSVIGSVSLDDAIGEGRGDIEARVTENMQRILDSYRSGVTIQGISIRQADPPAAVNEAFKQVTASQQQVQSYLNQARAYALQVTARAQGEATAFDKVYEEYRLAPEVTRRRLYYETMERVLRDVDKTIVEAPGVTPFLPLNQLQRQAQPQQPSGGNQATAGAAR
jgi:membrane protease subunit HflK